MSASTSYTYRVRATDAAGNLSPYSNTASATTPTPDTTPPSQPGTLSATAVSSGEVDLSWGASTDNVGVTGYRVERCTGSSCSNFTQIASTAGTGTTYADTTVSGSTSYSYRVRAFDAAGNLSPYSNTASATTPAAPSGLVAAYGFDEGSGTTVTDKSGNGNKGTVDEHDLVDDRQVRRGAAVQRHQLAGHDPRRHLAASHHGDDARGVGQPVDDRQHLARRGLQGQRQLLPRSDLDQRVAARRRHDRRRQLRRRVRDREADHQHLGVSDRDLRRVDAAAVRQRDARSPRLPTPGRSRPRPTRCRSAATASTASTSPG